MSNMIYINPDDITTVRSFGKTVYKKVFSQEFTSVHFLGLTFGKDETLYGTYPNFSRENGTVDKMNILYRMEIYIGKKWYHYTDGAFSFDEETNAIFRNPYVIVSTRSGGEFVKFFSNEKDMERYIDNLGIKNKLFGLEYN